MTSLERPEPFTAKGRARVVLGVVLAALSMGGPSPSAAQTGGFKLVVNSANDATALTREAVADFFLKKKTQWPSGRTVVVVDQVATAACRKSFSRIVIGRSVEAVVAYWHQEVFDGRGVPPPEKRTDREVMEFVRANPGAIGYVASDAKLGQGVKLMTLAN